MKGNARVESKRKLLRWIDSRITQSYGEKVPPRRRTDPLDELVLTVLSQNTNDVNRDRAYGELRRRFPRWADVLAADDAAVEDAIRVGGLARQKSQRIRRMLGEIERREGRLDLKRLCKAAPEEAKEYLLSFKGVGEKTAAIVMLFSCDQAAFPVDTHILRQSKRLGLVPPRATADEAHRIMGELVEPKRYYSFHINLIEHGRRVCHARKPDCPNCCLNTKCPSAGKV